MLELIPSTTPHQHIYVLIVFNTASIFFSRHLIENLRKMLAKTKIEAFLEGKGWKPKFLGHGSRIRKEATVQAIGKPTVLPSSKPSFLDFPYEIRHQIYSLVEAPDESLSRPTSHPCYALFFVSQILHSDMTIFFYNQVTRPIFAFFTPESCIEFLILTNAKIPLLTSLTLYIRDTRTYLLDAVFKKLVEGSSRLRHLTINLNHEPSNRPLRYWQPEFKWDKFPRYFVPFNCASHQTLDTGPFDSFEVATSMYPFLMCWNSGEKSLLGYGDFECKMEGHISAIKDAQACGSWLSKLKTIRYLRVHGTPLVEDGSGFGVDTFETSIIRCTMQMEEIASFENRILLRSKISAWCHVPYFEVWIQGEKSEMETPHDW